MVLKSNFITYLLTYLHHPVRPTASSDHLNGTSRTRETIPHSFLALT